MANVIPLRSERPPSPGASPPLLERSDDELMLLARGGAETAFATLIRRYQLAVLRVATRELTDPTLAKDVAQNTFVMLHRALPTYEARGRFKPYLFQILRNQCLMAVRKRKSLREDAGSPVPEIEEGVMATDTLLARERRKDVDRALSQLSDKLRAVVVMRFAGDLSHQEIAQALGVPVGTVKSRLFAALAELRQRWHGGDP